MNGQLPLPMQLRESASFANFVPGPNQTVYRTLQHLTDTHKAACVYLCGATGTGKTHLLQATCQQVSVRGEIPLYLSMRNCINTDVSAVFEGLETLDLVCLDDIHTIAKVPQWEQELFHLFNRLREADTPLLVSANDMPNNIGLQLRDLVSRLSWGGVFVLKPLPDDDKILALQRYAASRGFELPHKVAKYLLIHCCRDMQTLVDWLSQLDYASLATKRKITIPFVRKLLEAAQPSCSIEH